MKGKSILVTSAFIESFTKRVQKTEGCWLWTGPQRKPTGKGGWGAYGLFRPKRRINYYAHRFSWRINYGPIPDGMFVCHKCDNPTCVRPDHLFLGTHKDNMGDAKRKGRVRNQNFYVTECPRGHVYTDDNTYLHNRKRHCKACNRITALAYWRKKYKNVA